MGLTSSSTGSNLLCDGFLDIQKNCDFTIALAGNPNVREKYYF